jgi:hypothetical protein
VDETGPRRSPGISASTILVLLTQQDRFLAEEMRHAQDMETGSRACLCAVVRGYMSFAPQLAS